MNRIFIYILFLSSVSIPSLLLTNPSGEQTIQGECNFERTSESLSIRQQTDKAIVNWQDFSIAQGETTRILQPNEASAILNRVISNQPSSIYGNLQSNGQVFLINQNGVLIGPSCMIRTNRFVASVLDVANAEFLAGKEMTFSGERGSTVINQGMIDGLKGNVLLLSREIENVGTIEAKEGTVGLSAGSEVLLDEEGSQKFIIRVREQGTLSNTGLIESVQTELISAGGNSGALSINQEGTIHASSVVEREGRFFLEAEEGLVSVKGTMKAKDGGTIHVLGEFLFLEDQAVLDASGEFGGGEILIGGGFQGKDPAIQNASLTSIAPDVTISVDAITSGDAGRAIFWGDRACHFFGTASARGDAEGGDGGLVETSSHMDLRYQGFSDLTAACGTTGMLLLDPSDITISSGANAGTPLFITATTNYNPTSAAATENEADLQTALGAASVSILTAAGSGGVGAITVSATTSISWSAATTLTLTSDREITIAYGATLTNTHSSDPITFDAMIFTANETGGTNLAGISHTGGLSSISGNIGLSGTGGPSGTQCHGVRLNNGTADTITCTGSGNITVTVTAGGSGAGGLNLGILQDGEIRHSGAGNITMTGDASPTTSTAGTNSGLLIRASTTEQTGAGSITITGTGGGLLASNNGIRCESTGTITSAQNITMTGQGSTSGTTTLNHGITLSDSFAISHTGTGGTIALSGRGGSGSGACNGINTDRTANISGGAADITLTGTGGAVTTGDVNREALLNPTAVATTVVQTTTGTIGLSGTGGSGNNNTDGVIILAGITSGGNLTITGVSPANGQTLGNNRGGGDHGYSCLFQNRANEHYGYSRRRSRF